MRDHPQFTAYVALICLCFFWGTTYLGIRIGLESFPPAALVCARNLISGCVTLTCGMLLGAHLPRGRELWATAGFGLITLGLGNGGLTFAELWIPSGLASLFVSTSPFWFVGLDALLPGGEPLHTPTLRGMLVGSTGVALLAAPAAWNTISGGPQGNTGLWIGLIALQISAGGWTLGSLLQRRETVRAHPFISGAIGQLATGVVYLVPAALERQPIHWDTKGIGAIVYLAVFGGIVGFSCFMLVMSRLPVAIATIYTYVNPVVAMFLGWLVYRERVGVLEMIAMLVIFVGVAMVRRASRRLE
jgi:drug/metabolite transporter (DMT)-like permease